MNMIVALALFIIVLFGGYLLGSFTGQTVYVYETRKTVITQPYFIDKENISFASINVPAVDQDGNGVITRLDVQIIPGFGRTLTSIDTLFFWVDTQNSIRTAKSVAEDVTDINLLEYDIIYTITANASVIEGASAGAALTVATLAALQNKTINSSVMLTGTINHDGTIGPVGQVLAKAKAAKSAGAEILLVPLTQSNKITYETKKHCETRGFSEFCTTDTIQHELKVSDEADIEIIEVRTIQDAMEYLLFS